MAWPTHRSLADTRVFLELSDAAWAKWPLAGPYLVFARDGVTLLGSAGILNDDAERAQIGYIIARDAWGRGYATEALAAMRDLSAQLRLSRLYAMCHPDHRASARVLEKCGFALESTLKAHAEFPNLEPGIRADVACYVIHPAIC